MFNVYIKDRDTGHIHRLGEDRHDLLEVVNGTVQYYNLQNGGGTSPDGDGTYEFVSGNEPFEICPFCGFGCAEIATCKELGNCQNFEECEHNGFYSVVCNINKGGCGASGGYANNIEKAWEKWNRRK